LLNGERERDLDQFQHEDAEGQLQDWHRKHVTYGILLLSLASKVFLPVASEYSDHYS